MRNQDWLDFIVEQDNPNAEDGEKTYIYKPGYKSVSQEVRKQYEQLVKDDEKSLEFDRLLRIPPGEGGLYDHVWEGLTTDGVVQKEDALAWHNQFLAEHPDPVPFTRDNLNSYLYKGLGYVQQKNEEAGGGRAVYGVDRTRFEQSVFDPAIVSPFGMEFPFFGTKESPNPYLGIFSQERRETVLTRQRQVAKDMGKFNLSPLPTRDATGKVLYDTDKIDNVEDRELGVDAWELYAQVAESKADAHFDHGMYHDVARNYFDFLGGEDQYARAFQPDPDFSYVDNIEEFDKLEEGLPSTVVRRLRESNSLAEAYAVRNAAIEAQTELQQQDEYFSGPLGTAGGFAMDLSLGFADPLALGAGMATGGLGSAVGRARWGTEGLKAWTKRAVLDGAIGGVEGAAYMYMHAESSDPLRQEADIATGFATGFALGTAFELALGDVASKKIASTELGKRIGLTYEAESRAANHLDNEANRAKASVERVERIITEQDLEETENQRLAAEDAENRNDADVDSAVEESLADPTIRPIDPETQAEIDAIDDLPEFVPTKRKIQVADIVSVEQRALTYAALRDGLIKKDANGFVDESDVLALVNNFGRGAQIKGDDLGAIVNKAISKESRENKRAIYSTLVDQARYFLSRQFRSEIPEDSRQFDNALVMIGIMSDSKLNNVQKYQAIFDVINADLPIDVRKQYLKLIGDGAIEDGSLRALFDLYNNNSLEIGDAGELVIARREVPLIRDTTSLNEDGSSFMVADIRNGLEEAKKVSSKANKLDPDRTSDVQAIGGLGDYKELVDLISLLGRDPESSPIVARAVSLLEENPDLDVDDAFRQAEDFYKKEVGARLTEGDSTLGVIYDDPRGVEFAYHRFREDSTLKKLLDKLVPENSVDSFTGGMPQEALVAFSTRLRALEAKLADPDLKLSEAETRALRQLTDGIIPELANVRAGLKRLAGAGSDTTPGKGRNIRKALQSIAEGRPLTDAQQMAVYEYVGFYDINLLRTLARDYLDLDVELTDIPKPDHKKPFIGKPKKETKEGVRKYIDWYREQPERTRKIKAAVQEANIVRRRYARLKKALSTARILVKRRKAIVRQLSKVQSKIENTALPDELKELRRWESTLKGELAETDGNIRSLGEGVGVILDTQSLAALAAEVKAYDVYYQKVLKNRDEAMRGKYRNIDPDKAGFVTLDLLLGPMKFLGRALSRAFKGITKLDPRNFSKEHRKRKEEIRARVAESIVKDLTDDLRTDTATAIDMNRKAEQLATKYNLSKPEVYTTLQRLFDKRVGRTGKRPAFWGSHNPLDEPTNPLLDKKTLFSYDSLKQTLKEMEAFIENHAKESMPETFFDFDYDLATNDMLMERMQHLLDALHFMETWNQEDIVNDRNLATMQRVYEALDIDPSNEIRDGVYRFYARLGGMTGNILAPQTFKEVAYSRLTNKLHYLPYDIVVRELPHIDDLDFEIYNRIYHQMYFPFASDLLFTDTVGGNITYGMIADKLNGTMAISRDEGLSEMFDTFGLMVVHPHRSVMVALEELLRPLSDIASERPLTPEEVEAHLGPIGSTGLPEKLENLLVPSSKQDAWKRWVANTKEVLAGLTPQYPRERAKYYKRTMDEIEYILSNRLEFNVDDTTAAQLLSDLRYARGQYDSFRRLVENPLLEDVFADLQDLLDRYEEFFDESSRVWARDFDLERDKTVIEAQLHRLVVRLEDAKSNLDNMESKGDSDAARYAVNVKKAINQLHLMAGKPEKYPENSVNVQRLDLLRSAPFMPNRTPEALYQQLQYRLNEHIAKLHSQYGHTLPRHIASEVERIKAFLEEVRVSAEASKQFVDQTLRNTSDENIAGDPLTQARQRLDNYPERFENSIAADDAGHPFHRLNSEVQAIVETAFVEYVDNTRSLLASLKARGFGQETQQIGLGPFDPIPSLRDRVKIKTEDYKKRLAEFRKDISSLKTEEDVTNFILDNTKFGFLNDYVLALALKRAIQITEGGLSEAGSFLDKTIAEVANRPEVNDQFRDMLNDFKQDMLDGVSNDYTFFEKLNNIVDPPEDGDGTVFFAGLPPIDITKILPVLGKIPAKVGDWLSRAGSEIRMIYKGTLRKEFEAPPYKLNTPSRWVAWAGHDIPFSHGASILGPINKLRSMRGRSGANELGIIRMLGRMIYGSDLYELQDGKMYNAGDNHASNTSTRFGLVKYRARILGKLLKQVEDLRLKQERLQRILEVDDDEFNELISFVYRVTALEKAKASLVGKKVTIADILNKVATKEKDDIKSLVLLAASEDIDIPDKLKFPAFNEEQGQQFVDFVLGIERIKRNLSNNLSETNPLRIALENEMDVAVISNDSLLDVDRVLNIGHFERIVSDSLEVEGVIDREISPYARKILGYIVVKEIRAGKGSLLSNLNILTNIRSLNREKFIKLLQEHLDPSDLTDVFPEFDSGPFAGVSRGKLIERLANEVFPIENYGDTIQEMYFNLKDPLMVEVEHLTSAKNTIHLAVELLIQQTSNLTKDQRVGKNDLIAYLQYRNKLRTGKELTTTERAAAQKINPLIDDAIKQIEDNPHPYVLKQSRNFGQTINKIGAVSMFFFQAQLMKGFVFVLQEEPSGLC